MTEVEEKVFFSYIEDRSYSTQLTYKSVYKRLKKLLKCDAIAAVPIKTLVDKSMSQPINTAQSFLNIGLLVRRMLDMDTRLIDKQRSANKK